MHKKFTRNTVLAVMVGVFLLTGSSVLWARGEVVKFADFSWESVQLHNRIAGFIIEKGFDKPVEYLFVESLPGLMGIERGDIQLSMEGWVDNVPEFWAKAQEKGEMISLGKNFPDSPQGWYVPTFVIKGDPERGIEPMAPDLRSVEDLPKYAHLFADPEDPKKGRFLNGPTGWNVSSKNVQRLESYGLDAYYNNMFAGSSSALAAGIAGPYKQGKPVLAYYWEPTPILGMFDMTKLEEPPYDKEIWDSTGACAFPSCRVLKLANTAFIQENPDIEDFLRQYSTTLGLTNKVLAYMEQNDASLEETALWFLQEYQDLWKGWLENHPQAMLKVEAAL
jgi:glycine betaine/proline transport system substrate-binding protein